MNCDNWKYVQALVSITGQDDVNKITNNMSELTIFNVDKVWCYIKTVHIADTWKVAKNDENMEIVHMGLDVTQYFGIKEMVENIFKSLTDVFKRNKEYKELQPQIAIT